MGGVDGDIDAVWIESMNTVMDDNKVLTLVSNERVPLSDAMRMVFEINSLKNATPATVSRAGILYINESDIGWRPFVETWLADREKAELMTQIEAQNLLGLFDKYVDSTAAMTRKGFKKCTPIYLMNQVQTTVYLLEAQFDAAAGVEQTLGTHGEDLRLLSYLGLRRADDHRQTNRFPEAVQRRLQANVPDGLVSSRGRRLRLLF